jgi:hypothetical protein
MNPGNVRKRVRFEKFFAFHSSILFVLANYRQNSVYPEGGRLYEKSCNV